ncbi:hypothetical protein ES703_73759 [subsurface metagenome]
MVRVVNPFFSGWASGSVAKLITCRAMFNQRFCMHRYRHTQHRRSPAQIQIQEIGARKVKIALWFWKVAEWRSARLGMNRLGLSILGSSGGLIRPMSKIPPSEKWGPKE